jgi:uncharacterized protein (UPF0332 family)
LPDDEIDRLLFQVEARLEAARHLLKTGFYDGAVSRAYYSMYFAATAMFLARGIRVKTHRPPPTLVSPSRLRLNFVTCFSHQDHQLHEH